ncbi:cobaltochelatase subunit CobN [Niveispirillum sp. KHB5.9]|uniref:cobaltochelatase subunit CobN n=1 Tax=Niveispirillum sp. KHB5.9 TaxID=3400269 RepID=UPI003A8AFC70
MHLLPTREVDLAAPPTTEDLEQSPATLVLLSFSSSDLSVTAAAWRRERHRLPDLRLANLSRLGHPLSVDLYLDKVVAGSRLVILRLNGGAGYWRYGLERLTETCRHHGVMLAALPGEDAADAALDAAGTVPLPVARRLWSYFQEGGIDNTAHMLAYAASLTGHGAQWREPAPLPRFGHYTGWSGAVAAEAPPVALVFYRSHLQAGDVEPVHAMADALAARGLAPHLFHAASLKDVAAAPWLAGELARLRPAVVLNATGFSAIAPGADISPLDAADAPVLQMVLSIGTQEAWRAGTAGLGPADLAMNIVLPEMDGRCPGPAVAFKAEALFDPDLQYAPVVSRPLPDRIDALADRVAAWALLARTPKAERRLALVLSNYPGRGGVGYAVGLDTPASVGAILTALGAAGYDAAPAPDGMMVTLAGPAPDWAALSLADYRLLAGDGVRGRINGTWGTEESDPLFAGDGFRFPVVRCGKVLVAVQPSRGHGLLSSSQHHDPDTPPSHGYLAFHLWLRQRIAIHAMVQVGAHGTLEWLPGKAVALSADCWPELALGSVPCLYPFVLNNPGEGVQARRRLGAVLVGHLPPPPMPAGLHGDLAALEQALDEFAQAASLDPRRLPPLRDRILELAWGTGVAADLGFTPDADPESMLTRLDAHLCDIKDMQIGDGLHVFGRRQEAKGEARLLAALARFPRGRGEGADAALPPALALDMDLTDDVGALMSAPPESSWIQGIPMALGAWVEGVPLTCGRVRAGLERLAAALLDGTARPDPGWDRVPCILAGLHDRIAPRIAASADAEMAALLAGLDGRFVRPGPGGSPSRGRADTLPSGRNLFALDPRAVPTPTAWALGWKAADGVLTRHLQDQGDWPKRLVVDCWGSPALRTGGEDLALALALLGVRPCWEGASGRVTGMELLPAGVLGRPRVDVTLRISGLFRDMFAQQLALFDRAVAAVAALAEGEDINPLALHVRREAGDLVATGLPVDVAERHATARIFGAAAGAYDGAVGALIADGGWHGRSELGASYLDGSCHAYGQGLDGVPLPLQWRRRVQGSDALVHAQDHHDNDILNNDGMIAFEGGFAAAAESLGADPAIYHLDTADSERTTVRTLVEEVTRTLRGRAANPRWIAAMTRHGYAGAAEMAVAVDSAFALAALAGAVRSHQFDLLFDAYVADVAVSDFLRAENPAAAGHIATRLEEAMRRGLWHPRRNSTRADLTRLKAGYGD